MEQSDFEKQLFVAASEQYGDKYIEHLLEQYKIYIASAEKISDRRQKANEFFLALNTGLAALLGFIATKTIVSEITNLVVFACVAGIIMCLLWFEILRSYKNLNTAKFKIIHAVESRLPLSLYRTEWDTVERGKNSALYWPFTHIETIVPWIYVVVYFGLLYSMVSG